MESRSIDPETFSFDMPSTNQTSNNKSANSKLLALSVYILNTTEEFKELSYRLSKNTDQEESLVITHGDNLGLLGGNLDPVTIALTEKGICTINVLFRPTEKFCLLEKTLFDAGQFINILRRLTSKGQYSFCPGIGLVQPACFVKKLAYHAHPFSRHQSTDCAVWYKNNEDSDSKLLMVCKPCKDLLKFIQTLPQKKESAEKEDAKEEDEAEKEEEEEQESPKKSGRGRKKGKKAPAKRKSTNTKEKDLNSNNNNNSNVESEEVVNKTQPDNQTSKEESPKKSLAIEKSLSPRSSRRISERGSSFCRVCMCFHNDKDSKKGFPCQLASPSLAAAAEKEQEVDDDGGSSNVSPTSSKEKNTKDKRKIKVPVKRSSTESNATLPAAEEEVKKDVPAEEILLDVTEIKTEMEIGAEEELEFVLKAESDLEDGGIPDIEVDGTIIKEELDPDNTPAIIRRKGSKKGRGGRKKKSNQDSVDGSDQMDDVGAGASALLALTRGRKRDASGSGGSESPNKKPGRPRVLVSQSVAPSGIEALLTAAMTADKDDKGSVKKTHQPTPRSKKDELNTPFKLLMAQIEADKAKGLDSNKPWKCPECGDYYSSKGNLRRHLRIHDLDRPYYCPICNKTFVQKITLKVHMRLHSGDKPHVCNVCNRAFAQKSNMETHLRRHLGQRPYKCHLCNKGFSDKGSLGEHIKTHTGEQPYVCPICKKAFSQRANMRTHMRRHKDDRPYVCSECRKMFKNKDGFWKHITAVHNSRTPKTEIPNLQDLEMYRKTLNNKNVEADTTSEQIVEEIMETEITETSPGNIEKITSTDEPEEVIFKTHAGGLENGELVVQETVEEVVIEDDKKVVMQFVQEDDKKVVTQYVHSKEPVAIGHQNQSPVKTPTADSPLATQFQKTLPKISPKPSQGASKTLYPVIVNSLASKSPPSVPASLATNSATQTSVKDSIIIPTSTTTSNAIPSKLIKLINPSADAVMVTPSVTPVPTSCVATVTATPVTLTSSPPVNSGYISLNLVGSNGKPLGVQYVNPKDLGLTFNVQKASPTKFQVSSILSDNKSIVTSTIVTDPYTGKAVTFTPKTGTESPVAKANSLLGTKSPTVQGTGNLATIVQAVPVQSTVSKLGGKISLANIAPKKVIVPARTGGDQSTQTVLINMAPKLSTGQTISKPAVGKVLFTSGAGTEGPKIINSPKQGLKAVKTSLKSLVNASILKSVAEKCKASVTNSSTHPQPIVTSLLKSPPLSNVDRSGIEHDEMTSSVIKAASEASTSRDILLSPEVVIEAEPKPSEPSTILAEIASNVQISSAGDGSSTENSANHGDTNIHLSVTAGDKNTSITSESPISTTAVIVEKIC